MKFIGYFLLVALFIYLVAMYLGDVIGVRLSWENPYTSALIFAIILALVNLILGSILRFLTFPINFITFGLISFLISLLMIYVADGFYDNIAIEWFLAYIVVAIIPGLAGNIIGKK